MISVEDLTFHDSKSEFMQPNYNLKSGKSSYHCSWIYHLKATNPSSLKLNSLPLHRYLIRRHEVRGSLASISDNTILNLHVYNWESPGTVS